MLYSVINKDGYVLFENDSLSVITQYVASHQSGNENDPDYAYAVIDRSEELNTTSVVVNLNNVTDADVITKLAAQSDPQAYIIDLIRAN